MPKLRFALLLLLSTGNEALADIPEKVSRTYHSGYQRKPRMKIPNVVNQKPITDTESVNHTTIHNSNGTQMEFIHRTQRKNPHVIEDYDGEQYEDNRIRLMIYPKKTITLNETNLRTWKANTATNPYSSHSAATESLLVARRSGFTGGEAGDSVPEDITDSAGTTDSPGKQLINTTQTDGSLLNHTSLLKNETRRKASTFVAPAVNVNKDAIPFADNPTDNVKLFQKISNTIRSPAIIESKTDPPKVNSTEAVETATDSDYEDVESEQESSPEESNSYVIVLSGGNGNATQNISSIQPEIITSTLLYLLSNLTATNAMNQRSERKMLKELGEQKTQINDVREKLNNIYELLNKSN